MTKWEQIILAFLGLIVVGALYVLFFKGSEAALTAKELLNKPELDKIIESAKKLSKQYVVTEVEKSKLEKAETKPPQDPFYVKKEAVKTTAATKVETPEELQLSYAGFILMNTKKYAIINGMEYEVGDELDLGGYFVTGITKDSVIIGQRNATKDIVDQLIIPLDKETPNHIK